jgi:hypothetical protein
MLARIDLTIDMVTFFKAENNILISRLGQRINWMGVASAQGGRVIRSHHRAP